MKTKEMDLLRKALYALNQIPNQKEVGPKGESSYDIAAEIGRHIKEYDELQKPKYTTRFLFLNDCNGFEGHDPKADLVDVHTHISDVQEICEEIQKAEHTQAGVMRLGGSWRQALEMAEYPYTVIRSGKESDFDDSEFSAEYKVISGNY